MTLKLYRPVTSSQRGLILVDRSSLWSGRPLKSLTQGMRSSGGRNNVGRVTAYHRGGGHRRLYRFIDFKRAFSAEGRMDYVVERLEYDPNRTAFIALVSKPDGGRAYVIAPDQVKVGDTMTSGPSTDVRLGNTMYLKNIPVGTVVHNVEMKIGKGAQIARSAGSSVQVMGHDGDYVLLKLPSNEVRKIHGQCKATIGIVSNIDHKNICIAKAGRNRWKGWRPHVRGVAMNPIDHPHGGGEGRTSGGRHPVTPWGKSTKGKKTRSLKKASSRLIVYNRNRKK
jgi:large subunit ribosomal protein L2